MFSLQGFLSRAHARLEVPLPYIRRPTDSECAAGCIRSPAQELHRALRARGRKSIQYGAGNLALRTAVNPLLHVAYL